VTSYIGTLALDDELGFYTYPDPQAVPAEEIWLDEAAVEAARQGG
jgi:hypothetical protein